MPLLIISTGGPLGLTQGLTLGILSAAAFTLAFVALLMSKPGRPSDVAQALYAYILQAVGAVLMTISALPAMYGVLTDRSLDHNGYLGLLLVFLVGGYLFLRYEAKAQLIDEQSKEIPRMLFVYFFKIVAFATTTMAALQLLALILLNSLPYPDGWWISPAILLAYSAFLVWTTHMPAKHHTFHSTPMKKTTLLSIAKAKVSKKK